MPIDILFHRGEWTEFTSPRIETRHTHGTGCTFSAAITASLASGHDLPEAVRRAKRYITEAIRNNPGLGSGLRAAGPSRVYFESEGGASGVAGARLPAWAVPEE